MEGLAYFQYPIIGKGQYVYYFQNNHEIITFIVGCQGVVQLGGLGPVFDGGDPTKVRAFKPILFTESSSDLK